MTTDTDELVKRLAETKGHTPGPWVVDECRVGNGIYIRQAFPKYTGTSVARTLSDGSPLPLPDAEANARLMALAPEMKDTIERLQRELAARDKTIEALREDAERMDWLEAERTDVPGTLFRSNNRITRAAIDAARSEVGKP